MFSSYGHLKINLISILKEVLEWWKLMGWDEEGTVDMMRRKKVVGPDGVHLSVNANRFAAVSLCYRLAEKEVTISGGAAKKMRIG
jgi:hypothetical protein